MTRLLQERELQLIKSVSSTHRIQLFTCFSKSSLSLLIGQNCFVQRFFSEVGPKCWRYKKLRVRYLPQEEIADAHFATGADKELRIRDAGSRQKVFYCLFIYRVGLQDSCFHLFRDFP